MRIIIMHFKHGTWNYSTNQPYPCFNFLGFIVLSSVADQSGLHCLGSRETLHRTTPTARSRSLSASADAVDRPQHFGIYNRSLLKEPLKGAL